MNTEGNIQATEMLRMVQTRPQVSFVVERKPTMARHWQHHTALATTCKWDQGMQSKAPSRWAHCA